MHLLATNGHEAALNMLLAAAPRQTALASASPQTSDSEANELFLAPPKRPVVRPANLDIESLN
jgi:hypothetical protein